MEGHERQRKGRARTAAHQRRGGFLARLGRDVGLEDDLGSHGDLLVEMPAADVARGRDVEEEQARGEGRAEPAEEIHRTFSSGMGGRGGDDGGGGASPKAAIANRLITTTPR